MELKSEQIQIKVTEHKQTRGKSEKDGSEAEELIDQTLVNDENQLQVRVRSRTNQNQSMILFDSREKEELNSPRRNQSAEDENMCELLTSSMLQIFRNKENNQQKQQKNEVKDHDEWSHEEDNSNASRMEALDMEQELNEELLKTQIFKSKNMTCSQNLLNTISMPEVLMNDSNSNMGSNFNDESNRLTNSSSNKSGLPSGILNDDVDEQYINHLQQKQQIRGISKQYSDISKEVIQQIQVCEQKPEQNSDENLYTVQKGDTIFGLSMKFDISEHLIKTINHISDIFPGQKVKLPKKCFEKTETLMKRSEIKKMERSGSAFKSYLGVNYFDLHEKSKGVNMCYPFYCLTSTGNIIGYLRVADQTVMFDPNDSVYTQKTKVKIEKEKADHRKHDLLKKYQAAMDVKDIHDCKIIDQQRENGFIMTFSKQVKVLQITLYTNGSKTLHKRYEKKLQKMRKEGKPLIAVFFKLPEKDKNGFGYTDEEQISILEKLEKYINEQAKQYQEERDLDQEFLDNLELEKLGGMSSGEEDEEDKNKQEEYDNMYPLENKNNNRKSKPSYIITHVPSYDIIKENLYDNQVEKQIWKGLGFEPKMIGDNQSSILSQMMFLSILIKVPQIFRCTNWTLVYGTLVHGTSLNTMFNKCRGEYPIFVVIEDFDGNVFGAYVSTALERNHGKIQGNGETFVFTFANIKKKIKAYYSTGKNEDFLHIEDGITIGCSYTTALYIGKNLLQGSTSACDTFDNPQLTQKSDFLIKNIEVWGLAV